MSANARSALDRLRQRVELFRKEQTVDGAGGLVQTHVSLGLVWAQVMPAAGRLAESGGARTGQNSLTVRIRYRNDLSPGDRITLGARTFQIVSLGDADGRVAYLNCLCQETRTAG